MNLIPLPIQLGIGAAVIVATGALGYHEGVKREHERAAVILSAEKQAHTSDIQRITTAGAQAQEALRKQAEAAQAEVARIDSQRTKEKADALAENSRLAAALAAGTRQLRIAAVCPASRPGGSDVPQAPGTTSVGDATTVELPVATGLAVYQLRQSIIGDQAALRALQDYVRALTAKSAAQ